MTKAQQLYQMVGQLLNEFPEKGESEHYDQAIYGIVMTLDALVRVDDPEFEGTSFPVWVVEVKNHPELRGVYQQEQSADYIVKQFGSDATKYQAWVVLKKDIVVDE